MKIHLRDLCIADSEISYVWRNDPAIWEYTGSKPKIYITPAIEKEWLTNALTNTDQKRFAICINDNEQYIGNVQLTEIQNHKAQFHIFIGEKNFWGKGIASEATRLMVNYGFEYLGLKEIYLYVNRLNVAAIKAYEKCGFLKVETKGTQIKMKIYKLPERDL